jgi:hypothetical protein
VAPRSHRTPCLEILLRSFLNLLDWHYWNFDPSRFSGVSATGSSVISGVGEGATGSGSTGSGWRNRKMINTLSTEKPATITSVQ